MTLSIVVIQIESCLIRRRTSSVLDEETELFVNCRCENLIADKQLETFVKLLNCIRRRIEFYFDLSKRKCNSFFVVQQFCKDKKS